MSCPTGMTFFVGKTMKNWWKEAIVYQIYPRSFKDSNSDGIGDLRGITSKLDYLKDLGVDVIWLSPHFKSPNADNGYDISDYEAIMEDFGTMEDFNEMLHEIHAKGMKLIIDLVVNHSSDEHFWFQEARKSKENLYRDFYIWKKEIPNDWISFFSGNAWEYDEATQEFYLHLFVKKQPDLNWENPKLRQEIYKMMRYWLDKGVNGFRMDVISLISKDQNFPNFPEKRYGDLAFYANGPRVHEFLREMNEEVLSKYDCMTVGEAFGVNAEQAVLYTGKDRHELNTIYHFDHAVNRAEECFLKPAPEFELTELKAIFRRWDEAVSELGWNSIYWGNHDNPRVVSRFGDTEKYHRESAKMLATILLTLRGTAYIYQGDEIGMTNPIFKSINEYNDVQVLNAYQTLVNEQGGNEKDFLTASNTIARDHARTPMQWDSSLNAGFSEASKTWLKLNENYAEINVKDQLQDENSILNYYKKLIHFRKENPTLIYGTYEDLLPQDNEIWAYRRKGSDSEFLILCNFTNKNITIPIDLRHKSVVIGNYIGISKSTLRPFEAIILS